ncbi:hypothetical protein [Komagataeibacter europaeus]|uniref:hypothetical protein n=1 Tax=Komagataeibacter europaeus TaxID=33995 RepID=UPI0012F86987|nr:hypothetical protein [Komagataeibacter europaeus]GBQ47541.1 hypothetical protein AA18890_2789 [Komagataeibacter europaeus LMG 18890]
MIEYNKKRTNIHEAGHAVALWRIHGVVAPKLLSTQIYQGQGECLYPDVAGFADLGDCGQPSTPDEAIDLMAVYYAGKVAVDQAIEIGELAPAPYTEWEPGWLGFSTMSGQISNPPSSDHDWVEFLANKWAMPNELGYSAAELKERAEEKAYQEIECGWNSVLKISEELSSSQAILRIKLREMLAPNWDS